MAVTPSLVAKLGAAVAATVLCAWPATALAKKTRVHDRQALSLDDAAGLSSFTPAAANPGMAAALSRGGLRDGFRFTPSSSTPGRRRAVTVAVRTQTSKVAQSRTFIAPAPTLVPSAYNLGAAVGWRRFALSGEFARVDGGLLPVGRQSADVGLSYLGRNWRTTLQLGADRSTGDSQNLNGNEVYSVDFGGAYELSRNFAVTGGLRYQVRHDRLQNLADDRRDSQAVYLGTAFRF